MLDCNNIKTSGSFTIVVDRIGAVGTEVPYQLFGASDGIHAVENNGVLAGFIPEVHANGASPAKVAQFNSKGELEIIDDNGGSPIGVRISASKIPYKTLLELIKSQSKPLDVALTTASTKITHTVDSSRSQQLSVRNRSYFQTLQDTNYDLDDYFSENQEQSTIVRVDEVIDIMPVTKIDSLMSSDETKLVFTFTLQVV